MICAVRRGATHQLWQQQQNTTMMARITIQVQLSSKIRQKQLLFIYVLPFSENVLRASSLLLPHTLTFYEGIHFLLLQKNLLREIFILPEEAFHFWSVLNRSARFRNGIYRKENTTSFFSFRTSFPSKRFPVRLERKPRMVAVERVARRRMISCFEISR